mgnify:CR=1 FL=1
MTDGVLEFVTVSPSETLALGATIAAWLEPGDILLLHGDLGAGKTTLGKGIAQALGIETVVSSPTFSLVNEYAVNHQAGLEGQSLRLVHLDLYRLEEDDLDSIGIDELLASPNAVILVEWPERAVAHLPDRYLLIEIRATEADTRQFRFSAEPPDQRWQERLGTLGAMVFASLRA